MFNCKTFEIKPINYTLEETSTHNKSAKTQAGSVFVTRDPNLLSPK